MNERFAVISSCNGGRYPWMVHDAEHEFELYCRTREQADSLKDVVELAHRMGENHAEST